MKQKQSGGCFERIDTWVVRFVRWLSYLGMVGLLAIAAISTVNVIASKVFSHPISNVVELVTYLNLPIVFFCIGYVQLDRGHTHIDLLYRRFPTAVQVGIHVLGDLVGLAVCGFAGWRTLLLTVEKYTKVSYASGPSSFVIWPFVACISIGYIVLALCYFWSIFRELTGRSPYEIDNGGKEETEVQA